jgi:3'-phosphoadenosine 5'-phosphosulfate sulfotransferase (PAPS reductase)/FAD synthetase
MAIAILETEQAAALTLLSFGGGQDSTAIALKLIHDPDFRERFAPGMLLAVMADTGNEHPDTLEHVAYMAEHVFKPAGIPFVHLTPDLGFHSDSWATLDTQYALHNTVGSVAFPKTCTDNLKIKPIYRWLEQWISEHYGFKAGRKNAIKTFAKTYGKIDVIIGIAKGEEKRVADSSKDAPWMQRSINRIYPLLEIGYGRAECQAYMAEFIDYKVPPSNCLMCPFKSKEEVLWTALVHPEAFDQWCMREANKLVANADQENNLGVKGKKTLAQITADAFNDLIPKFDHDKNALIAYLTDYRMSHGHCVSQRF